MMLRMFNEYLENLVALKKQLVTVVKATDWDETKKEQTLRILEETSFTLKASRSTRGYSNVDVEKIKLSFSYEECHASDGDALTAEKYVKALCEDLNIISPTIKFGLVSSVPFVNVITVSILTTF